MAEERLKLAVFIDFDNIQIGVKDTLGKEFDVSIVLEALKERGEVVTKVAYGDWPRAGEHSRDMTQHAVQMVQRNVTPRGDKNGADINLALDALEMAFTRHHINAFAIVGGDSDFIALVEKLKQYDKRVYVVGGRAFTSNILQRNCTEFIAYENLLRAASGGDGPRVARTSRRGAGSARVAVEARPLSEAFSNVQRALQILADRNVAPQIGLLKSTLLQLDSTFSERDFGVASFLEFMQKMEAAHLVHLRRTDRGFLVESANGGAAPAAPSEGVAPETAATPAAEDSIGEPAPPVSAEPSLSGAEALQLLRQALSAANQKAPNRPLYLRQIRHAMRTADKSFDERQYGPRGVLDLLYQAQREGVVRLQRDRKGVLRIFAVASALESPTVPTAEPVPVIQSEAAASTDFWEAPEAVTAEGSVSEAGEAQADATTVPEELAVPEQEVIAADLPSDRPPGRRTRRARATSRTPRRRTTHRKPKEPSND